MTRQDFVREVYDASYRRLVVQLFALTSDLAEAEDAVQEAFVKALSKGRSFDQVDNPEAWLRTAALNHVRNRWRHAEVVRRLRTKVPGPTPGAEVGPEHVALVEALAKLDTSHRTVVVLHYLADRSIADISTELEVPEGTVKTRLARSRELLAPLLSEIRSPRLCILSLCTLSLRRPTMPSFASELDVLHEVGHVVRQPAFDELIDVRGRRTRRSRIATASALTVAAIAVAGSIVATGGHLNSDPPPIAPTPSPKPTVEFAIPAGQKTITPDIRPRDVAGFQVLATVTNSQPEHRGDSELSFTFPDATVYMSDYCRGPSDLYLFTDIGDGGGGFGPCSPDAETSFDPGDISDQSQSEPDGDGLRTVRMWVARPSAAWLKCQHGNSGDCSDLQDVQPITNPDADFGMQFYKDPVRPVLQFFDYDAYNGGGYSLGALSRINGVSWLLDRVVLAAPDARRLAFEVPASDTDHLIDVYTEGTPRSDRCPARHEDELPDFEHTDHGIYAAAEDKLCGADLRLIVDGIRIAPEDIYPEVTGHFQELGVRLAAGVDHQIEVKVVRGDPRNIRYAVADTHSDPGA